MTHDEINKWRDALADAKQSAKDWRDFAVFWFALCAISFGAFVVECMRHAK